MKIAINTRFLLKNKIEGIGRVSYEIIKRIVRQHPEDEFIFCFDRPYDPSFVFANNVKPIVVNPPARHPFLWYLWFEISLPRVLKKYKPDVFFSPDNYLSLKADTPTVMVTHDLAYVYYPKQIPYLVRKYYNHFVPRYIQRADQIIAVSEYTKEDILKNSNVPAEKVTVAYNACTDNFIPLSEEQKQSVKNRLTKGSDYFFYLGSIHPRKNVAGLIKAFDQFKSTSGSQIKLLLAGRLAWQTGTVKEAFENAKHREDIIQVGFLDKEELPKVVGAAKALVYVSFFEGFGLPILEAMNCDVPVITSNVSSMPEVAGDAAILVDPNSIDAIAKAMKKILNEERTQELIVKGRVQREKFNWDRSAQIVYEALQKAVRKS